MRTSGCRVIVLAAIGQGDQKGASEYSKENRAIFDSNRLFRKTITQAGKMDFSLPRYWHRHQGQICRYSLQLAGHRRFFSSHYFWHRAFCLFQILTHRRKTGIWTVVSWSTRTWMRCPLLSSLIWTCLFSQLLVLRKIIIWWPSLRRSEFHYTSFWALDHCPN